MKAVHKLSSYEKLDLEKLELVALNPTAQPVGSQFKETMQKMWQGFLHYWNTRNELQIWQRRDRFGTLRWHAYDPVTGNYTSLGSEDELRSWIESQYYQGQHR